jgi:hypothetical protein
VLPAPGKYTHSSGKKCPYPLSCPTSGIKLMSKVIVCLKQQVSLFSMVSPLIQEATLNTP